jgi:nucleoside 2-deoxyribosyltransferase
MARRIVDWRALAPTIYFSGSITGGREDVALYGRIVEALETAGYRVLAGAVASEHVGPGGEALERSAIYERDLRWIDQSEAVVAEVSKPSTGVGYELAYARHWRRIPVICLWRPAYSERCTAMVEGDRGIQVLKYADGELEAVLPRLLEALRIKFS